MKKWQIAVIVIGLIVVACIASWLLSRHQPAPQPHGVSHPATHSVVKQTVGKAGPRAYYPDASYTPGAIATSDPALVCRDHYTKQVRHVTRSQKKRIFAHYGVRYPARQGTYEFDHFIPLELGGSNADENLWPEPAAPIPGFHEKDVVENYLHRQVCVVHTMTLIEAQRQIRTDWYAVYLLHIK